MTMHSPADTFIHMPQHWTIEYLKYVKAHAGKSLSAIAAEAKMSSTTLTRPTSDPDYPYEVKIKNIEKVRNVTGIDYEPFRDGAEPAPKHVQIGESPEDGASLVPVFNVEASAGGGAIVGEEYQVAILSFPEGYLQRVTRSNPRDLKVISVKGDSMTPTLEDDDVVMLDVSKRDLSYDGLFVIRDNGDALLVKRIGRASKSGFISIISDNAKHYPPVERAQDDIEVIGKVIWKGGKV